MNVDTKPSARMWLTAAGEVVAAVAVTVLLFRWRSSVSGGHHGHGETGTELLAGNGWSGSEIVLIGLTAVAIGTWVISRSRVAAGLGAIGVVAVAGAEPTRVLAAQSHLVAMAALEALLVVAPLLTLAALPARDREPRPGGSRWWSLAACGCAALYAGAVIAVHLPMAYHHRGAHPVVPLWAAVVLFVAGVAYWSLILRTAGRVGWRVRRAALVGSQEVAAFIGLLSLLGGLATPGERSPLGMTQVWDQRLGGLLMLVTCACVVIPMMRRMTRQGVAASSISG